eukprot:364840-Chlamydomonas_euryale.AAC.2
MKGSKEHSMAVAAFKGALSALHYFPELLFQNLTRFGPAKASWDMHARRSSCASCAETLAACGGRRSSSNTAKATRSKSLGSDRGYTRQVGPLAPTAATAARIRRQVRDATAGRTRRRPPLLRAVQGTEGRLGLKQQMAPLGQPIRPLGREAILRSMRALAEKAGVQSHVGLHSRSCGRASDRFVSSIPRGVHAGLARARLS